MFLKGFLALFFCSLPHLAFAGAWTAPTATWQSYHDIAYYSTDHYYDVEGNRFNQPTYKKVEQTNRFEYGWSDELTLGAAFAIAAVKGTESSFLPTGSPFLTPVRVDVTLWNYGISDPKFYLRQRLWQNNVAVVSTQATLKFPSLFQQPDLPRTGSDEFSYEARVLGGHNFNWLGQSQFGNLEAAYEWRPQNDGDLLHIDASLGWEIGEKLMILPQVFSTWKTSDNNNIFTQSGNDSYDLVKPQLSITYQLQPNLTLQAGAFHHAYARNSGGGSGIILGMWMK